MALSAADLDIVIELKRSWWVYYTAESYPETIRQRMVQAFTRTAVAGIFARKYPLATIKKIEEA